MFPFDEEEEKTVPMEMNPVVKDSLMKKFNLGPYSDQARMDLQKQTAPNGYDALSSALSAVSAGFTGRDPASAALGVIGKAQERGQDQLNQFDKGRSNKIQEIGMNREEEKYQKELKDTAEDDDPNSAKSKIQQGLAAKMVPGKDFSGIPASKLSQMLPSLTKIYDIDQKKIERQDSRAQKNYEMKTKQDEKSLVKDEKKKTLLNEVEDRRTNIKDNLALLKQQIKDKGTYEAFGSHNADLNRRVEAVATDMAKLADPNSVARPAEVEAFKKGLIETNMASMSNDTALKVLDNFENEVDKRAANAYKIRGIDAPAQSMSSDLDAQSMMRQKRIQELKSKLGK